MRTLLAIAVDGVAYGMVLFIISIGLSITLGLMRVINLAHGAFAMVGGYLCAWLVGSVGLPYAPAALLAVALTMALAAPLEWLLFRRIYATGEPLVQVLMTIGITFVLVGGANWIFGPTLKIIPLPFAVSGPVDLGFRTIPAHRLLVIAAGLVVALGAWALLELTSFGVRLRAAVDDAPMAGALGIRTERVYAWAFAGGVGLAAAGGILGAEILPLEPWYALRYMVTFLVVACVGGPGSIGGALAAALLLGLVDTAGRYAAPELGGFFFYLAVILVVLAFPRGLLGRRA